MADGKVLLEVVVEGKNVKVVQREVEQVTGAVNENTKAQERNSKANRQSASSQQENARASRQNAAATQDAGNSARKAAGEHAHYDRALKGMHQSNLSGAKSFSKIRDAVDGGSSGLVAAYATLAANMFAATAAFTGLQKAAQVEQLSKGLSALGTASGLAMQSLSKGLQQSTGYAISLQDSMKSVAMVTSAGFDPAVIDRLGKVAKNTSTALGRDLQDSLNRVVKGAVKLEPELLDELGIMVRIDEASQMYAQSLGKNASQLTNFEKRQAFMNAVLAEGERKFGAIGDAAGVNPYDRMSASLQELSVTILNAFNVILSPIVGFLADAKLAFAGLVLILSKGLIATALPALSQMAQKSAALAQRASIAAKEADKQTSKDIENTKKRINAIKDETGGYGQKAVAAARAADTIQAKEAAIKKMQIAAKTADTKSKKEGISPEEKAKYEQRVAFLNREIAAQRELIKLEEKRGKGTGVGKAASARAQFYGKGAERLESLTNDASLSNYRQQFKGSLKDAQKFRDRMAKTGEAAGPLTSGLKSAGEGMQKYAANATNAGLASRLFAGTANGAGKASLWLSKALSTASFGFISFGNAAKIAIKGIFAAIPIIGQLLFVIDLLIQGVKWVIDLFTSDASKRYSKKLEEAKEKTKELNDASIELNKALFDKSRTIQTLSQKVDAQANIVKQAADNYYDLKGAAIAANDSLHDVIQLTDSQIDSNIMLQRQLANLTGGYTDINKWRKENNKSEQETIEILDKLMDSSEKSILAQQNLVKSTQDAGKAFLDYKNSFKNTTPYSVYVQKLEDVDRAFKDVSDNSKKGLVNIQGNIEAFGALSTRLEAMDPAEVKHYGEAFASLRDGVIEVNKEITKINDQINTLKAFKKESIFTVGSLVGFDFSNATQSFKGFMEETVSFASHGFTKLIKSVPQFYSSILGEGKKARDEVNNILRSTGQEEIGFFTSQATYEERSIKAQNILELKRRNWIKDGEKISQAAEDVLFKELEIVKNLERKAALVEIEKSNLQLINKLNEAQGYQTSADLAKQEETQNRLFVAQKSYIEDQIKNTIRFRDEAAEGSSERALYESKILELQNESATITAENMAYEMKAQLRLAEAEIKRIEFVQKGERELLNILEERFKLSNSQLDTEKKRQEISAQLASAKAGGSGELSAAQNEKIFNDQFIRRKQQIDIETNNKLRVLDLDAALNKAKLLVSIEEMKVVQKQLFLAKIRAGWVGEEADNIQNQLYQSTNAINDLNDLYSTYDAFTEAQRSNIRADAQNQKDGLELEREKQKNNKDSYQVAVDIAQAYNDAGNQLNDIITKMINARTTIIDSEQTILENQIKADNRKKTGKGELTAKQESDIANKYLKKRIDIINEERDAKIKMIDLEYKLLEAKTRFEALSVQGRMQDLKDRLKTPDTGGRIRGEISQEEFRAQAEQYGRQVSEIDALGTSLTNTINEILRLIPGARGLETQAATRGAQAATSTAQEDAAAKAEAAAEQARTLKQRAYETELEFIKSVVDLQQKILDFNNSILDNQRTIDENAQKTANLRNKGIGKFELTAEQNAKIEFDYQEKRKALLLQEKEIKLATIEAEYGLLDAQLAVQKWRMQQDVERLRDEAIKNGDSALAGRMAELLSNGPNSIEAKFARAAALVQPAMVAAQAAAAKEYEAGVSEATAAQVQAMEEAFGWTTRMTTSWESVSTAIGENFKRTLQESKSITQELADAFTNSVNAAVDGFVDALVEGKNVFKAMGDGFRNALRDAFAEAAKNKLKEGIAAIFEGLKLGDLFKTPEQKAAEDTANSSKSTAENTGKSTTALENIEKNLGDPKATWDCIKTATETTIPTAVNELKTSIDTSVVGGLTTLNDTLINVINTTLNTINTTLSSILAKPCCESSAQPVTNEMFIESAVNAIKAAFPVPPVPAATGGRISGPGGPKDDKIPAMLSNGEFVVNAKATKDNLKLLQAINSGNLPGFGLGGLFGEGKTLITHANRDFSRATKSIPKRLLDIAGYLIPGISELATTLGLAAGTKDPLFKKSVEEIIQVLYKNPTYLDIFKFKARNWSPEFAAKLASAAGLTMAGPLLDLWGAWEIGQFIGNQLNEHTDIQKILANSIDQMTGLAPVSAKESSTYVGRATGGMISGPGGPKDDKIPAMLSNGEFVVNAASTKKYLSLLQAINRGNIPKFEGGTTVPIGANNSGTPLMWNTPSTRRVNNSLNQTAQSTAATADATKNIDDSVNTWGKIQKFATDNLGDIMTNGLLGVASAISSGRSAKKAFGGAVLGGLGGALGSALGNWFGGPAGAVIGEKIGATLGGGIANREFAMGGVMTSSGPLPLEKYAKGGIARTPQLAMFGEGRKPEAYVPLPDGRSIPVSMNGGGAGNVNNISVNVSVSGGQAQTQTSSAGGKDQTEAQGRMLGIAVSNAVKQELLNQQRPGGLLYKGRK